MKKAQTPALTEERLAELKKTATTLLVYSRQQILTKMPFTGTVGMSLNIVPVRDYRVNTACTDGSNIFVDIDFLSKLDEREREFVLAHEIWHVVLMHFLRKGTRLDMPFNLAADMEINQLLVNEGCYPPPSLIFPNNSFSRESKFNYPSGLSMEEYYELIIKDNKNNPNSNQNGQGGNGGNGKSGKGSALDGQFDQHIDPTQSIQSDFTQEELEQIAKQFSDKYGVKGVDKDFISNPLNTKEKQQAAADRIRENIVGASQMVEKTRGSLPGYLEKLVKSFLKPVVNWKEVLANFITTSFFNKTDWNRPNRRFVYSGTYLPSHTGEMVRLAIGIDTSGSCSNSIEKFMSEVLGIAKEFDGYELHLIQCDTEVKAYDLCNEENPFDPTRIKFKGFGGTTLHPILDYVQDKELDVDAIIMFTDGECEEFTQADDIGLPMLWVIDNSKSFEAKNIQIGQKIRYEAPNQD